HLLRAHGLAANVERAVAIRRADDLVRHAPRFFTHLFEAPPNETFRAEDGVFRIRDGLPLGDLADENLTLVVPGDHARRDARALLVHDDLGLPPFHDRDAAVRGAEIDSDDLAHGLLPPRGPSEFAGKLITREAASTALGTELEQEPCKWDALRFF